MSIIASVCLVCMPFYGFFAHSMMAYIVQGDEQREIVFSSPGVAIEFPIGRIVQNYSRNTSSSNLVDDTTDKLAAV
ncbi:hypothetical protein BDZ91DRAFT_206437 [Kalaharituber pfeilii]|nr:hypothetical protein BDZ91DRAFT_206437 [Kalaharituber pfeilii]